MSSDLQTIAALVIVAIAATWLVVRAVRHRRQPGCSGGCACPTRALKR